MKELIVYLPVILAGIAGFALEVEKLSLQAQEATTEFLEHAVRAIDCAYTARPLSECAPELFNDEHRKQIEEYQELLQRQSHLR